MLQLLQPAGFLCPHCICNGDVLFNVLISFCIYSCNTDAVDTLLQPLFRLVKHWGKLTSLSMEKRSRHSLALTSRKITYHCMIEQSMQEGLNHQCPLMLDRIRASGAGRKYPIILLPRHYTRFGLNHKYFELTCWIKLSLM